MQKYIQVLCLLLQDSLFFSTNSLTFVHFFALHCGPAFGNQLLLTGSDNFLILGTHVSSVAINSALTGDDP